MEDSNRDGGRCQRFRHVWLLTVALLVGTAPQARVLAQPPETEEFGLGSGVSTGGGTGGYIDSAIIENTVRFRFDAGFDLNRPDRAEYIYGSWVNLLDHPHAIKDTNLIVSSVNNRGPIFLGQTNDIQVISSYLELAYKNRVSVFAELPFRFVQFIGDGDSPEAFETPEFREAYDNADTEPEGVSDLIVGFKCGMLNAPDFLMTFQLRTFIPTGKSSEGLGTGHVSLEPALLTQARLTENLSMMGQAKLWAPINGGVNAGHIAIYGAGLSYDLYQGRKSNRCLSRRKLRFVPTVEFLGWTVLDGFETLSSPESLPVVPNTAVVPFDPTLVNEAGDHPVQVPPFVGTDLTSAPVSHGVQVANSQTIVNAKLGCRTHFGAKDSVYVGWGRSLTGARWYKDFLRVEFRRLF